VQCSAVQCSAVQCSAVQCSAVQCSALVSLQGYVSSFHFPCQSPTLFAEDGLFCTALCTTLHYALHCIALCTTLCTVHCALHCALHCVLHCTVHYLHCTGIFTNGSFITIWGIWVFVYLAKCRYLEWSSTPPFQPSGCVAPIWASQHGRILRPRSGELTGRWAQWTSLGQISG
jgi:hypothetical protein